VLLLWFLLLCIFNPGYAAPGTFFSDGQWVGYKYQQNLGDSDPPAQSKAVRPVLMTFKHSDHGLGFGKMIWDGKRQIELYANIVQVQPFSVYPYHVRIVLYDPENKEIRNEHLSIGVTWQNYSWSGPSLQHLWKPGLQGGYSLAQKPLSELSKQPFGIWKLVFYKDMNLKGTGAADQWKWEPLAQYEFEITNGSDSGSANATKEKSTEVKVSPLYANDPVTLAGVRFEFKKYDMQRYKEDNQWKWTIHYCEVYADGELVAKISSEQMNAGDVFTKVIGTRQNPRTVKLTIVEMPKVTSLMECRGPVLPCKTMPHPVSRGQHILLNLSVLE
jgi:hypothetical protein